MFIPRSFLLFVKNLFIIYIYIYKISIFDLMNTEIVYKGDNKKYLNFDCFHYEIFV